MEISVRKLQQARDTLSTLLGDIGLADYLFEVEPKRGVLLSKSHNIPWQ